jgi:hypothetical protein
MMMEQLKQMSLEQKVDRILILLEGEGPDSPGLFSRVTKIEAVLYGEGQVIGLRTKTLIMWRCYIWLLCTMSAIIGGAATMILKHLL